MAARTEYDALWRKDAPMKLGQKLPPRVKDWPEDARVEFKRVKNELYKWAKKNGFPAGRLALTAYEAVRMTWEQPSVDEWFDALGAFIANPTKGNARELGVTLVPDDPPGPTAQLGPLYDPSCERR